jgi:hypothetical protein
MAFPSFCSFLIFVLDEYFIVRSIPSSIWRFNLPGFLAILIFFAVLTMIIYAFTNFIATKVTNKLLRILGLVVICFVFLGILWLDIQMLPYIANGGWLPSLPLSLLERAVRGA